ncbi:MAG: Fic family protein [Actinomycetota bacterium]|nr:Fic family protein [Actinomycetota bacterium]
MTAEDSGRQPTRMLTSLSGPWYSVTGPVLQARHIIEVLNKNQVDYVLIGGYAAAMYGAKQPTYDIDITPDSGSANLTRLATAPRELGAGNRVDDLPAGLPFDTSAEAPAGVRTLNLRTPHGDVDLTFEPAGTGGYPDLAVHAVQLRVDGEPVQTAALDDVIRSKEAAGRDKDNEALPGLIDDLVRFSGRTDLPVLAQAAIAHAQFETNHPFADGNGRTGRALIHAMLRGHGLTRNVTVPVSAGLLTDTRAYFDSLTLYRRGEPHSIVERLAEASFAATANGRRLVADPRDIRQRWTDKIKFRRGGAAWRLADLLLRQPVIDATVVANDLGIETGNAGRAIAPLVDAKVLTEFTGFKRNRMWQSREVLTALDDFAGRR